jgi:hypothetical protein
VGESERERREVEGMEQWNCIVRQRGYVCGSISNRGTKMDRFLQSSTVRMRSYDSQRWYSQ